MGLRVRYVALGAAAVGVLGNLLVAPRSSGRHTLPWMVLDLAGLAAIYGLERRRPLLPRRSVYAVVGLLLVLAAVMPVRRSKDLWQYALYGRMVAVHHESPYTHVPADFPDDPFTSRLNPEWRDRVSVYGPLFVGVAAGVMEATGSSPLATRLAFQGLAALAVGAALVIVDRRKRDPAAVALIALNPAVIVFGVGGGHSDALIGLAILGACVLAVDHKPVLSGLAVAAAALVKLVAGIALLPLAWWTWRRRGPHAAVRVAIAGAAATALGELTSGTTALRALTKLTGEVSWSSPWRWWLYTRTAAGHRLAEAERLSTLMVAVTVVLVVLVVLRRTGEDHPAALVGAALATYVIAAPYALLWYLGRAVPVLALRWRSTTTTIVMAWSAVIVLAAEWSYASGRAPGWLYLASAAAMVGLLVTGRGRYSPPPPDVVPPPRAHPVHAG